MSEDNFSATQYCPVLTGKPSFFRDHADIFSELRVPHPNETRAISLGERQIMMLRARTKDLEWKLSGLMQHATGNERISGTLTDWCCRLLAEDARQQLPGLILRSLSDMFDLPAVALRLWNLPGLENHEFTEDVTDTIRDYARSLEKPYCGPIAGHEAAGWLAAPASSIAIVPLRATPQDSPVGLLVLGSPDPEHFSADMGTVFLETIGRLACASLSRLGQPGTPDAA